MSWTITCEDAPSETNALKTDEVMCLLQSLFSNSNAILAKSRHERVYHTIEA